MAQSTDLLSLINTPSHTPSPHLLNHLSYLLLATPTLVPPPPPESDYDYDYNPDYPIRDTFVENLISKALRATRDFWANSIRIDTFSTNSTDFIFYLPSDTFITTSTNYTE